MSFVPARCPSCSALILIERIQRIWAIELLKRSLHWVCTLSGFLLAAWNAALQAPAWHGPPVWIHGDLLPGNLLVHSGRITAVIDFACLGVGDPACDLILRGRSSRPIRATSSVQRSSPMMQCGRKAEAGHCPSGSSLPYYQHSNPVFAALARKIIVEFLADWDLRRK
jgi:hypothetical protein